MSSCNDDHLAPLWRSHRPAEVSPKMFSDPDALSKVTIHPFHPLRKLTPRSSSLSVSHIVGGGALGAGSNGQSFITSTILNHSQPFSTTRTDRPCRTLQVDSAGVWAIFADDFLTSVCASFIFSPSLISEILVKQKLNNLNLNYWGPSDPAGLCNLMLGPADLSWSSKLRMQKLCRNLKEF